MAIKTFGYDAVKMSANLTLIEMANLGNEVRDNPESKNKNGGIHVYSEDASKKLDSIGFAITAKLREVRRHREIKERNI